MNYFLQFLVILVLVILGSAKVTLQSAASRKYIRNAQDSILYNTMFFASVATCFALFFPHSAVNGEIVLLAAIVSSLTVTFQIIYSIALTIGPVSITVLIVNFHIFIVTLISAIVFHETLYLTQVLGIVFLIFSMLYSVKRSADEKKATSKWLFLTLISMFSTGLASTAQKLFHLTPSAQIENASNTFLLWIYILSASIALLVAVFRSHFGKREKSTFWFNKNVLFYAMAVGAIICVYQKFYMFGLSNLDGMFMFPTYSGMVALFMTTIGILFFKDKLTKRQLCGVALGICSVVLMNLRLLPLGA